MKHHNGNPDIHNTVNKIRGQAWVDELEKKKYTIVKTNVQFYKDAIEKYDKNN